jgi:hypothetical protein
MGVGQYRRGAVMAEQIETHDGTEFVVKKWVCPGCGYCQADSVHPVYGPWVSCTCEECGEAFSDESLDADSLANWDDARATAEAYGTIHGMEQ